MSAKAGGGFRNVVLLSLVASVSHLLVAGRKVIR